VVTQFFLRDPDGYFIEICNCDILTKFCLAKDETRDIFYNESSIDIGMAGALFWAAPAPAARAAWRMPGSHNHPHQVRTQKIPT
jgi:hypothetical protein